MKRDLLARNRQLWVVTDSDHAIIACATTRIVKHDLITVCEMPELAGGEMRDWLHLQPKLEAWARSQGCQELMGFDRGGWARVLGWEPMYTIIRKRLDVPA